MVTGPILVIHWGVHHQLGFNDSGVAVKGAGDQSVLHKEINDDSTQSW